MREIDVRDRIPGEIFDYQALNEALKELSYPRDKITDLLRQKTIIRVKKGLYVFGERFRRRPYSKELLANLIYGPSYISLDYALAFRGMIPERVEALTSVTMNRSRRFHTPVGLFSYRGIPARAYEVGMVRVEADDQQAFLIASPEKALADKIVSVRGGGLSSAKELSRFLEEDLRIDLGSLAEFSTEKVDEYAERYRSAKLKYFSAFLKKLQSPRQEIGHE